MPPPSLLAGHKGSVAAVVAVGSSSEAVVAVVAAETAGGLGLPAGVDGLESGSGGAAKRYASRSTKWSMFWG